MEKTCDIICTGMALIDSIIKGFNPEPVSASGYRAESGSACGRPSCARSEGTTRAI